MRVETGTKQGFQIAVVIFFIKMGVALIQAGDWWQVAVGLLVLLMAANLLRTVAGWLWYHFVQPVLTKLILRYQRRDYSQG